MLHSLTRTQIKELEKNQEICSDLPPVTYRATFKLSRVLELISEIVSDPDFKPDNDETHNICIVLVREDIKKLKESKSPLEYHNCANSNNLEELKAKKDGIEYTQVIPIITGCLAKLDGSRNCKSFRYLRVNGSIPYVRSGGEGTGLIPPPPSGSE